MWSVGFMGLFALAVLFAFQNLSLNLSLNLLPRVVSYMSLSVHFASFIDESISGWPTSSSYQPVEREVGFYSSISAADKRDPISFSFCPFRPTCVCFQGVARLSNVIHLSHIAPTAESCRLPVCGKLGQ